MGNMYKDLLERPKTTVVISEISYFGGNSKVEVDDVINKLKDVKKRNSKKYEKIWLDIDGHTDEWGHYTGSTLVIKGERFMTDKEWITVLQRASNMHRNEKERYEMHNNYYTKGMYDEDHNAILNKISEIKKEKV